MEFIKYVFKFRFVLSIYIIFFPYCYYSYVLSTNYGKVVHSRLIALLMSTQFCTHTVYLNSFQVAYKKQTLFKHQISNAIVLSPPFSCFINERITFNTMKRPRMGCTPLSSNIVPVTLLCLSVTGTCPSRNVASAYKSKRRGFFASLKCSFDDGRQKRPNKISFFFRILKIKYYKESIQMANRTERIGYKDHVEASDIH